MARTSQLNVSQVGSTALGGSTAALRAVASCQALTCLMNEGDFYQSKLSIAEKLAEKHTKDLAKQGIPTDVVTSNEQLLTDAVSRVSLSGSILDSAGMLIDFCVRF